MSDPIAKAARSKAKDARQEPAPDAKPKRKPGKKDRPWKVDYKWLRLNSLMMRAGYDHGWCKFGAYRTKEEAESVIKQQSRKSDYFEYRLVEPE